MLVLYKLLCVILFMFYSIQCIRLPAELSDTFGPFRAEWTDFTQCSGPKRINLTKSTARFVKVDNSYILYMNMSILETVHVDHIKVDVYTRTNNNNNILWRHRLDNPCKYFALGEVLFKYFNVSRSCMLRKGEQRIIANMTAMAYAFYGNSFYYGSYLMKGSAFSNKGNLLCISLNTVYRKL